MAEQDEVVGKVIEGTYHDAGSIDTYLEAVVDVALSDPRVAGKLEKFLRDRLAN